MSDNSEPSGYQNAMSLIGGFLLMVGLIYVFVVVLSWMVSTKEGRITVVVLGVLCLFGAMISPPAHTTANARIQETVPTWPSYWQNELRQSTCVTNGTVRQCWQISD